MRRRDDGTILITPTEARQLVDEMNLGTSLAKVIGEALTSALEGTDVEERTVVIEVSLEN